MQTHLKVLKGPGSDIFYMEILSLVRRNPWTNRSELIEYFDLTHAGINGFMKSVANAGYLERVKKKKNKESTGAVWHWKLTAKGLAHLEGHGY